MSSAWDSLFLFGGMGLVCVLQNYGLNCVVCSSLCSCRLYRTVAGLLYSVYNAKCDVRYSGNYLIPVLRLLCEWLVSRPGGFTSGTNWIGGWVGPGTCLDDMERRKILAFGRPARSQSLYRIRYPGSPVLNCTLNKYGVIALTGFNGLRIETNVRLL
jgi:hypothetical protein